MTPSPKDPRLVCACCMTTEVGMWSPICHGCALLIGAAPSGIPTQAAKSSEQPNKTEAKALGPDEPPAWPFPSGQPPVEPSNG